MARRPPARDIVQISISKLIFVSVPALFLYWLGVDTKIFVEFGNFLIQGKVNAVNTFWDSMTVRTTAIFLCVFAFIQSVIIIFNLIFFGLSPPKDRKEEPLPYDAIVIYNLFWAFVEEAFFRLGFLGLSMHSHWLYPLVIVSSVLFGLAHLQNHEDRLIFRVAPQIFAGFVLAFIFLKYGFWIAVLFHASINIVLEIFYRIYKHWFFASFKRFVYGE